MSVLLGVTHDAVFYQRQLATYLVRVCAIRQIARLRMHGENGIGHKLSQ